MEKALITTKEKFDSATHQKKPGTKKEKFYNCGFKGHWARECRKPKKSNERHQQQANVTEAEDTHALFWTAADADRKESTSVWYIDSSASQHMPCRKDWMENYRDFPVPEKVRLGDNRTVDAHGKGSVWLKIEAGGEYKPAELSEVLYVPDLAKNLFSVSAVSKRGLTIVFKQDKCHILNDHDGIMGSGKKDGKLFILDSKPMSKSFHEANSAVDEKSLELWHQRFGHLGVKNLKLLHDQKLVDGMKLNNSEDMKFCEGCVKGKQKRNSFPKGQATRATELLEIVHSDVCGPMQTTSLGGNRYFVTFIDDKSRYTAIYFMKSKDQVLEKFREYEAMATTVSGNKIKTMTASDSTDKKIKNLRSDNRGEYSSKEFDDFLTSKGIKKQRSVPRTPEQNGVAERMNRTIQETARSMLHGAGLSDDFWGEAVATAVVLRNRSPTVAVKDTTPYECFNGRKPDVAHLKVFGCDTYMHVPKELRKKWDAKSQKCIFIGYSLYRKGYRLYDPRTKRLHESRDVVFVENEFGDRTQMKKADAEKVDATDVSEPVITSDEKEDHETDDGENINDSESDPDLDEENNQNIEDLQQPHRSNRMRKAPERDGVITGDWWEFEESLNADAYENSEEPTTIQQALNSSAKEKWKEALDSEYTSLIKNRAWNLVKLPEGRKPVGCRWVFKVKHNADGSIERYKARLVAKGYSQEEGIDYEETYSPVARYTSIRSVLAIANQLDLELHQMDVQTAFLNEELEEEIYVTTRRVQRERQRKLCLQVE